IIMSSVETSIVKLTLVGIVIGAIGAVTGSPLSGKASDKPRSAPPTASATSSATSSAPEDAGWPRTYTTTSGARVVLYQPQIVAWPEQKHMTLAAAVSYLAKGAEKAALGTLKVETDAQVAVSERLVSFSEFQITAANFATLPKDQVGAVMAEIRDAVPRRGRVIGLDRLLAMVDA